MTNNLKKNMFHQKQFSYRADYPKNDLNHMNTIAITTNTLPDILTNEKTHDDRFLFTLEGWRQDDAKIDDDDNNNINNSIHSGDVDDENTKLLKKSPKDNFHKNILSNLSDNLTRNLDKKTHIRNLNSLLQASNNRDIQRLNSINQLRSKKSQIKFFDMDKGISPNKGLSFEKHSPIKLKPLIDENNHHHHQQQHLNPYPHHQSQQQEYTINHYVITFDKLPNNNNIIQRDNSANHRSNQHSIHNIHNVNVPNTHSRPSILNNNNNNNNNNISLIENNSFTSNGINHDKPSVTHFEKNLESTASNPILLEINDTLQDLNDKRNKFLQKCTQINTTSNNYSTNPNLTSKAYLSTEETLDTSMTNKTFNNNKEEFSTPKLPRVNKKFRNKTLNFVEITQENIHSNKHSGSKRQKSFKTMIHNQDFNIKTFLDKKPEKIASSNLITQQQDFIKLEKKFNTLRRIINEESYNNNNCFELVKNVNTLMDQNTLNNNNSNKTNRSPIKNPDLRYINRDKGNIKGCSNDNDKSILPCLNSPLTKEKKEIFLRRYQQQQFRHQQQQQQQIDDNVNLNQYSNNNPHIFHKYERNHSYNGLISQKTEKFLVNHKLMNNNAKPDEEIIELVLQTKKIPDETTCDELKTQRQLDYKLKKEGKSPRGKDQDDITMLTYCTSNLTDFINEMKVSKNFTSPTNPVNSKLNPKSIKMNTPSKCYIASSKGSNSGILNALNFNLDNEFRLDISQRKDMLNPLLKNANLKK